MYRTHAQSVNIGRKRLESSDQAGSVKKSRRGCCELLSLQYARPGGANLDLGPYQSHAATCQAPSKHVQISDEWVAHLSRFPSSASSGSHSIEAVCRASPMPALFMIKSNSIRSSQCFEISLRGNAALCKSTSRMPTLRRSQRQYLLCPIAMALTE
nr:hypothetical protein CFP56_21915 [Quercus suber]